MKHILITIAAMLLVGCGESQSPRFSIHEAAYTGNIEAVKQHLAAGTDVNAKEGVFGTTPLHPAAANDHKELAELLIEKGANVKIKDQYLV